MGERGEADGEENAETVKIVSLVSNETELLCPGVKGRTTDEVTGGAGLEAEEGKVMEEDHAVKMGDVTEPASSSDIALQTAEAMRKVREAIYSVFLFHIVDLRKLMDKRELTNGVFLSRAVDLALNEPPYNV